MIHALSLDADGRRGNGAGTRLRGGPHDTTHARGGRLLVDVPELSRLISLSVSGTPRLPGLTSAEADWLVRTALAVGAERDFAPLAVAVIDVAGEVIVLRRDDGGMPMTSRIAVAKARTALFALRPSGQIDLPGGDHRQHPAPLQWRLRPVGRRRSGHRRRGDPRCRGRVRRPCPRRRGGRADGRAAVAGEPFRRIDRKTRAPCYRAVCAGPGGPRPATTSVMATG